MSESYPIIEVREDWLLSPEERQEAMGSKDKFWYRPEEDSTRWLFKYPQGISGEHWAEKIAEQLARLLDIPHARVELAQFAGSRGSVAESFVSGELELFHGNQILAGIVQGYDPYMRFGQSNHTLENIWLALDHIFEGIGRATEAKLQFAEYVVLDGVIGNTDRHHENWGAIHSKLSEAGTVEYVAPSFDHASSLGRELEDRRRAMLIAENRVGRYSGRGRGGIYWFQTDRRGPSPTNLVLLATERYPELFRPTLAKLDSISDDSLREIVERTPRDWMSQTARDFAIALMRYNLGKIREAIQ